MKCCEHQFTEYALESVAFFVSLRGNLRGMMPYKQGPQCSACPIWFPSCKNGLCGMLSLSATSHHAPFSPSVTNLPIFQLHTHTRPEHIRILSLHKLTLQYTTHSTYACMHARQSCSYPTVRENYAANHRVITGNFSALSTYMPLYIWLSV